MLALTGMGLGADRILVTYHENFSSYAKLVDFIKQQPAVKIEEARSFIVNLANGSHFSSLTFSDLANYIARMKTKK